MIHVITYTPETKATIKAFNDFPEIMNRNLDRFLSRGAEEAARMMKDKSPKAFSTNANSIKADKQAINDYLIKPHTNYGGYIEDGTDPHMPPVRNLLPWVERVLGLTGKASLRAAKNIAWAIKENGTRAQPYIEPTATSIKDRVIELATHGVNAGIKEAFTK